MDKHNNILLSFDVDIYFIREICKEVEQFLKTIEQTYFRGIFKVNKYLDIF